MPKSSNTDLTDRLFTAQDAPNKWERWIYRQMDTYKFPRAQKDVYVAWGILLEEDSKELPSIVKLATYACCSEKTVRRALKNAQSFKILDTEMRPMVG